MSDKNTRASRGRKALIAAAVAVLVGGGFAVASNGADTAPPTLPASANAPDPDNPPPLLEPDPVNKPARPPKDMSNIKLHESPLPVTSTCSGVKGKLAQYRDNTRDWDGESLRGLLESSTAFQDGVSSFSGSVRDLEEVELGMSTVRREWSTALAVIDSGNPTKADQHVHKADKELQRLIGVLKCKAPATGR